MRKKKNEITTKITDLDDLIEGGFIVNLRMVVSIILANLLGSKTTKK